VRKIKNMVFSKENKAFSIRNSVIFLLSIIGLIFFLLSYTTGYYSFGQMNSIIILTLIVFSLISVGSSIILNIKHQNEPIISILTITITLLLIASAILLLGDRIQGIGFTVLTKFDAGRGGEEASYLSFVAMGSFLIACIINIVGGFFPSFKKKIVVIEK
jgi:predicted ferric reductase